MEHYRTRFQDRDIVLRDLEERDIATLVSYWFDSPSAYLTSIGVDVTKLRSRDEMAARLRASIGAAVPERAYFVVAADDRVLAYTNLNFRTPEVAYAHVHILDDALRGRGFASQLMVRAFQLFFERFPLERVVLETSPENLGVNGLLQKFGLRPEVRDLDVPDGMARPGRFNVYTVERAQMAAFLAPRS
jgi:RimJ/RimL family protein N-acetyltransferase